MMENILLSSWSFLLASLLANNILITAKLAMKNRTPSQELWEDSCWYSIEILPPGIYTCQQSHIPGLLLPVKILVA